VAFSHPFSFHQDVDLIFDTKLFRQLFQYKKKIVSHNKLTETNRLITFANHVSVFYRAGIRRTSTLNNGLKVAEQNWKAMAMMDTTSFRRFPSTGGTSGGANLKQVRNTD